MKTLGYRYRNEQPGMGVHRINGFEKFGGLKSVVETIVG